MVLCNSNNTLTFSCNVCILACILASTITKPTNATNIGQIVLTTGITVSISKFHALLPVSIFGYDYLTTYSIKLNYTFNDQYCENSKTAFTQYDSKFFLHLYKYR